MGSYTWSEFVTALLKALEKTGQLSEIEALKRASDVSNHIVEVIVANPSLSQDDRHSLYSGAAKAYVLASQKVPEDKKDFVAFPSNYWWMRAQQTLFEPKFSQDNRGVNAEKVGCGAAAEKV